ncbi:hypothetical protein D3C78_1447390 [compost metagenome]
MAVENIHIIKSQTIQARIRGFNDMLARQAAVIGTVADFPIHLGSQHIRFTSVVAQRLANNPLCLAFGIYIRRIEEVNAQLISLLNRFHRIFALNIPAIGQPASKTDIAYLQAACT